MIVPSRINDPSEQPRFRTEEHRHLVVVMYKDENRPIAEIARLTGYARQTIRLWIDTEDFGHLQRILFRY